MNKTKLKNLNHEREIVHTETKEITLRKVQHLKDDVNRLCTYTQPIANEVLQMQKKALARIKVCVDSAMK